MAHSLTKFTARRRHLTNYGASRSYDPFEAATKEMTGILAAHFVICTLLSSHEDVMNILLQTIEGKDCALVRIRKDKTGYALHRMCLAIDRFIAEKSNEQRKVNVNWVSLWQGKWKSLSTGTRISPS